MRNARRGGPTCHQWLLAVLGLLMSTAGPAFAVPAEAGTGSVDALTSEPGIMAYAAMRQAADDVAAQLRAHETFAGKTVLLTTDNKVGVLRVAYEAFAQQLEQLVRLYPPTCPTDAGREG